MAEDDENWNPLCARTTVVLRAFLAGKADRTRDPAVREHLASCAACRARYEEAVEAAAHVGGAQRKQREEALLRSARIAKRRKQHPGAEAAEAARRARGHRLRLLLLPAALILLMTQLGRLSRGVPVETRPIALRVGGVVQAAGRTIAGEDDPVTLTRGQRCETGTDGSALLRTGRVSLTLDPDTRVLVESSSRFRLERGGVAVDGTCAVTTSLGVLEVEDGAGRLALKDGRLLATVERDRLTWVDPTGVHVLAPGPERIVAVRPDLARGL